MSERETVLVGLSEQTLFFMRHAAERLGRDLTGLAQTAVEEAALDYARHHDLFAEYQASIAAARPGPKL